MTMFTKDDLTLLSRLLRLERRLCHRWNNTLHPTRQSDAVYRAKRRIQRCERVLRKVRTEQQAAD